MLRLFPFKWRKAPPAPATLLPDGFTAVQTAQDLLLPPHRRHLLTRIWQHTALSHAQFERLYLSPLQRFAERVQLLPASETHHHAYPGGMLDHGLELVACALKLRQAHLLPTGIPPEDQSAEADAWSAGIAYAALLHDIGKIAVDLEVEQQDGQWWHPWHGPLNQAYRFRYRAGRDYHLHAAAGGLVHTQILARPILDWLSGFPTLWGSLLYALAGQYERAGVLGDVVIQADRISTARNIGANPEKALQAPRHSLQFHLLTGLRHLLLHDFKLNQPGAAGWLTEDSLWLVSKTATDKLRAWLLAQSVDGIPASNLAVFDELQSHGLVQATPEGKAIWTATIEDGDWVQTFTLLRIQPGLIWGEQQRPDSFTGRVSIAQREHTVEPCNPMIDEPTTPKETTVEPGLAAARVSANGDFNTDDVDQVDSTRSRTALVYSDNPGQAFWDWLKTGIESHQLIINDSNAKVHTVAGMAFLVTPGIFQQYCQVYPGIAQGANKTEEWRWLQRRFEALRLHRKRPDGLNIWSCRVQGPRRKASTITGYLIEPAELFDVPPADNPYLHLVGTEEMPPEG